MKEWLNVYNLLYKQRKYMFFWIISISIANFFVNKNTDKNYLQSLIIVMLVLGFETELKNYKSYVALPIDKIDLLNKMILVRMLVYLPLILSLYSGNFFGTDVNLLNPISLYGLMIFSMVPIHYSYKWIMIPIAEFLIYFEFCSFVLIPLGIISYFYLRKSLFKEGSLS